MSAELVEAFARNAEAAGFAVHRGRPPEPLGGTESTALYAVAATGSVVLAASPDEPRAASLLTDRHVTLVPEERVVADLAALFAALGPELPSSLAIVTGPSRTADIELRLVVGVHGPADVHVVIVPATRGNP